MSEAPSPRFGGTPVAIGNVDEPATDGKPRFGGIPVSSAPVEPLTFAKSVGRGVDLAQSMGFGAMEAAIEAHGPEQMPELYTIATEGRERNMAEAEAAGPRTRVTDIDDIGDFGQWVKETVGEQLPLMAPSLAGGAAGAGIGAMTGPAAPIAVPIGAAIGAFVPSFVLGTGETQQAIKEKDPNAVAPGHAFAAGGAIAALDTVLPGKIGSTLVRKLGVGVAEQVARRTLMTRVAVEAGKGMATESFTEALQEAISEVTAAQATGKPISPDLPEQMLEAAAAGALMGGSVQGGMAIIPDKEPPESGRPPRAVPGQPVEPGPQGLPSPATAPAPGPAPSLLPAAVRERLSGLGYSPTEIGVITPDIANRIVGGNIRKPGTAPVTPPPQPQPVAAPQPVPQAAPAQPAPTSPIQTQTEPIAPQTAPVAAPAPVPDPTPRVDPGSRVRVFGPDGTSIGEATVSGYREGKRPRVQLSGLEDLGLKAPYLDLVRLEPMTEAEAVTVDVERAAEMVDTEPTDAMKEAGNYKKGHVNYRGLDIAIETPQGAERTGTGRDGEQWSVTMPAHYGYVKRTEGADGDHVDVYLGPDAESDQVFVVDQIDPETGAFDEHKAILGTRVPEEALGLYDAGFSDGSGPQRRGAVTPMLLDEFKDWLKNGDTKKPLSYSPPEAPVDKTEPVSDLVAEPPAQPTPAPTATPGLAPVGERAQPDLLGGEGVQERDQLRLEQARALVSKALENGATAKEIRDDINELTISYRDGYSAQSELFEFDDALRLAEDSIFRQEAIKAVSRDEEAAARRAKQYQSQRTPEPEPGEPSPEGEPALNIEDYTAKSIIIRGETKENIDRIKGALSDIRPRWNRKAVGWIFPKKREAEVRAALSDLLGGETANVSRETPKTGGGGPRVLVNMIGKDGLTDAEREAGKRPYDDAGRRDQLVSEANKDMPAGYNLNIRERDVLYLDLPGGGTSAQAGSFYTLSEDRARRAIAGALDIAREHAGAAQNTSSEEAVARKIGENTDGEDVWEDPNGVRSVRAGGIIRTESVGVSPGGGVSVNTSRRSDEYKTREEVRADQNRQAQKSGVPPVEDAREAQRQENIRKMKEAEENGVEAPEGYQVGPAEPVKDAEEARVKGGAYTAIGRREAPWSVDRGYGDTPQEAQRDALRRVGAYEDDVPAWAEVMGAMPKDENGEADVMVTFNVMSAVSGISQPSWKDLTGEQKAEVLRRVKTLPGRDPNITPEPSITSKPQKSVDYGSQNKLVTKDRAEELRARLKEKLRNQLSSGIDPEILAIGTELAVYHIEAGARKFPDLARAIAADLETAIDKIRPYLRGWYNGARDMMEDAGVDVSGMDNPDQVRAALDTLGEDTENETNAVNSSTIQPQENDSDEQIRSEAGPAPQGQSAAGVRTPARERSSARLPDIDGQGSRGNAGQPRGQVSPREDGQDARSGEVGDIGRRDQNDANAERGEAVRRGSGEQRVSAESGRRRGSDRADGSLRGQNYRITDDDAIGAGGPKVKFRTNLEAIRLAKKIEEEKRPATREEQASIVKFVGWGGMPQVFDEKNAQWAQERADLRKVLTEKEWDAARFSTVNAHYTSAEVIRTMWQGMETFGFKRGKVLEPGMGVGHFLGLSPDKNIKFTGVELDPITGKIARALYPSADIRIQGFEETVLPEDSFDLAIGNVPFANFKPTDPKYNKPGYSLHNYFFAKSLALTKPGGYMAFITSSFTMDAVNPSFRKAMAESADLVGAVRLPNTAFKGNAGTEVVTDLIILRKRKPGETPRGENWAVSSGEDMRFNEYFQGNPRDVLGKLTMTGSVYGKDTMTVEPDTSRPIEAQLADALNRIAVRAKAAGLGFDPIESDNPATRNDGARDDVLSGAETPSDLQEGSLFVHNNIIHTKQYGAGVPAKVSAKNKGRVKQLIELRDLARKLLDEQGQEWDGKGKEPWAATQKKLNQTYDRFVEKHGPVNKHQTRRGVSTNKAGERKEYFYNVYPNLREFKEDPAYPLLLALESYNEETGKAAKSPLFSKRVKSPQRVVRDIENVNDALAASLSEHGAVDLDYMAEISGMDRAAVIEGLKGRIYRNPGTGQWEAADQYLSGNVRDKLALAQKMAKGDQSYAENVEALEAAQPVDLAPGEIVARLGSPWIPPGDIEAFISELLGDTGTSVSHVPQLGLWRLTGRGARRSVAASEEWGTGRRSAYDLIEDALNSKTPVVVDKMEDGSTVKNADETLKAGAAQQKIKDRFSRWVWEDDARADRLARKYNDEFNNMAPRAFDGSHLELPGSSNIIELRPHQKDAVWRTIQNGNTLYAHEVGAGKTFTSIAAGMEMKRIGLVNKPGYVVPNHMLEQFAREFLLLYPSARLLIADKANFEGAKRRQFVARAATGDWDAVIIKHSSFERIPVKPQFEADFIKEQIAEYETLMQEARAAEGKGAPSVKELEKAKKRREEKLKLLQGKEKKDTGISFEDTGIDYLFVDEFHLFKNLEFPTKMQGISASASERAQDMFLKINYLERQNPGRTITAMTATPISNSVAEMFTMQRYLQMPMLAQRGLTHFDAWAGAFGDTVTAYELSPDGGSFRQSTRFAKFVNVPELSQMFTDVADVKTASDLKLPKPDLAGGKPEIVVVEPTPLLEEYVQSLVKRAEDVRNRKVEPTEDNMLKITSDGRKAALDMRLVGMPMTEDRAKLAAAAERIKEIHDRTAENEYTDPETGQTDPRKGGAQMVFLDLSTPSKDGSFSVYNALRARLVKAGIPESEIAFIHDFDSDDKKGNLFKDVRSGKVRVIFGSTQKMGVGTNVQKRLVAMHHLDAPWRPADVEQRDGRIMRQGNQNPEAEVIRYVTEGSFDIYMWQTLERKARFIEQVMRGTGSREVEDVDGSALSYAEVKALATGNPLIMEKAEVNGEVQRLERLETAHQQSQWRLRKSRLAAVESIKAIENKIRSIEQTMPMREDVKGDAFKVTIEGATYDERTPAGEALEAVAIREASKYLDTAEPYNEVIGEFGGFPLAMTVDMNSFDKQVWVSVSLDAPVDMDAENTLEEFKGGGTLTKLSNRMTDLDKRLERDQRDLERARDEVEKADKLTGQPFDQQEKLDSLRARQAEIEDTLKEDEEKKAPQAPEEGGEDISFSRAQRSGSVSPLDAVKLDAIVKRITARWGDDVTVRPVEGFSDLPSVIQQAARKQDSDGSDVRGVYHNGTIYLVRENIASTREVEEVLFHEGYGHLGLRLIAGPRLSSALGELYEAIGGAEGFARISDQYGLDLSAYEQGVQGETREQILMDELLAHIAEQNGPSVKRAFKEVIGAVREWLRKHGFLSLSRYNDTDLLHILREARRAVERGSGVPVNEEDAPRLSDESNPEDIRFSLGREVDAGEYEETISKIIAATDKPVSQRLRDGIAAFKDRRGLAQKQGWFDQFAVVEAYEKAAFGDLLSAEMSPFKATHMTQNLQSVMAAVLRYGPLKVENGWFALDESFGKGFEDIFAPLAEAGTLRLWKGWAIANRSQRLIQEGREALLTQDMIDELLPLEQQHPEFREVLDEWMAFNRRMLDMAEAAGLINREQRALWERSDYVPFYRVLEDEETIMGARKGRTGLADQRSGIRTLKGGESKVNDPLENMVLSMTSLVDRSFKNLAMQKVTALVEDTGAMEPVGMDFKPALVPAAEAAKRLREMGVEIDELASSEKEQILSMFQMTAPQAPDVISVMIAGKPAYYQVNDPLLLRSVTSLNPAQLSGIMNVLRMSRRVLTEGVTADPAFMLRNAVRDTLSAWVLYGGSGVKPGIDSVKGFIKALKGDTALAQIMASGGGSGGFYRTDPKDVRKLMDAKHRGTDRGTIIDSPKKAWEFWHRIGQASEAANRIAVAEAVKKSGGSKTEAAYQALDLMDFSMRGDFAAMRFLAETVPFLNARVQGLYRLYRGARDNPKAFWLRGSILMGASMALLAVNWDDERYQELEDWDKDAYYHFWLGDQHFRMPKPFEVGAIFSTVPERMIRLLAGKDDGEKAAKRMLAMFADTFAMNPIPQLFKPMVEQWANRESFTGRPIVGQSLERLSPEAQWSPWTSETARMLGKAMPDFMGEARSPERIEALVRGYFGALGTYALSVSDSAVRLFGDMPEKPEKRIDEIPVLGSFVRDDPARGTVYMNDFYELNREASVLLNTVREYERRGMTEEAKGLLADKADKIAVARGVNRVATQMAHINRAMRSVYNSRSMSPAEKRLEIDRLTEAKNRIARMVMQKAPALGKAALEQQRNKRADDKMSAIAEGRD